MSTANCGNAGLASKAVANLTTCMLSRSGCLDDAVKVLQEAEEKGYRVNEATYVEIVTACERAGHWKKAVSILEEMRRREYKFYSNILFDGIFKSLVKGWAEATRADSSS